MSLVYFKRNFLVLLVLLLLVGFVSGQAWPDNEPSGMTVIVSGDGSDKYFGNQGNSSWSFGAKWNDNTFVEGNIADADSRYGTVIEKRFFVGATSGWNGIASLGDWGDNYDEVYYRWIVKYSSNYDTHNSGEKHFYFGINDANNPNHATAFYIVMKANREIGVVDQSNVAGT